MTRLREFLAFLFLILGKCNTALIEISIKQVPKYYTPLNEDIFLCGSFNNWSPNSPEYKFKKSGFEKFELDFDLSVGKYEYMFTRGSFMTNGTKSNNETLVEIIEIIDNSQNVKLEPIIENWYDMIGTHTVVGNVYIVDQRFPYKQMRSTKGIHIYLPADYHETSKTYPVIYMQDGITLFDRFFGLKFSPYVEEWEIDESLEEYFKQNKETTIVVGLDTTYERTFELTPYRNIRDQGGMGDKYLDFMINDLKPFIDREFRTKPEREYTSLIGSSFGSFITMYASIKHQDVFSKFGVISPTFWFSEKIYELVETTDIKYDDIKLYMCWGTYETHVITNDAMKMINLLKSKGFTKNMLKYSIDSDGEHTGVYWRKQFRKAFEWFYH